MQKLKFTEIQRIAPRALAEAVRHPIVVVIENVRSAYNVGSILRTCDAALVERVIVTGYTPSPDHPKVRKTALGAETTIPWEAAPDIRRVVDQLKADGFLVAALEITDHPTLIEELAMQHFPLALIVGNEVSGLTDEAIDLADLAIEIPQYGSKQSLNVAVALGIAVMGAVEQFRRIRPRHP
ncbi:TrmH family RNA methyltransferase [Bacteroidota bacterium]